MSVLQFLVIVFLTALYTSAWWTLFTETVKENFATWGFLIMIFVISMTIAILVLGGGYAIDNWNK